MKAKAIALADTQNRYFEMGLRLWILSGVPLTLLGNATSDIWLSVTAALFLVIHGAKQDWGWTSTRWFQMTILFWLWALFVSNPFFTSWDSSFEALPWIRFPLFALALPFFLSLYPGLFRQLTWTMIAGLVFLAFVLVIEKLSNPEATRLYGTWNQNTKIGWFVVGLGLPVSYFLFEKIISQPKTALWAVPLICLFVLSCVLTGEIYVTLSFLLGLGLIVLACRPNVKVIMALVALSTVACVVVFLAQPELAKRFYISLTLRLPWLPTSDYFAPWMRGLKIVEMQPVFGIGVHNFKSACLHTPELLEISKRVCQPHPHQLYIQVAAETGLVGLALFLAFIFFLFRQVFNAGRQAAWSFAVLASLCLLVTLLWPISTYSNAFGQHKNFFTWFGIAWALYLAHSAKPPRAADAT